MRIEGLPEDVLVALHGYTCRHGVATGEPCANCAAEHPPQPMFDSIEDLQVSQQQLIEDECERLTWYSNHPARRREEQRLARKTEK